METYESWSLSVVFQPIVELASRQVLGHEVLGRAYDHRAGVAGPPPDVLLEEAHARGELLELDRRFRAAAIRTIASLESPERWLWFLNVDTRVFDANAHTAGFTRTTLAEHGVPDLRVVIELSERDPVLDAERLARLVPDYARQGFPIALDDLGAGHASLNRLIELRPDIAKLDKRIIHKLHVDPMRMALVRAMVQFARETGLVLIAEGIESAAELQALERLGVAYGQGYFLGRPTRVPKGHPILPALGDASFQAVTPA